MKRWHGVKLGFQKFLKFNNLNREKLFSKVRKVLGIYNQQISDVQFFGGVSKLPTIGS